MLVFSSELTMQSLRPSGLPSQEPAYRSKTRPAFSENFGSRGKIQYLYRHGLIASASRMRQTVLGLMDRPKAVAARSARSEVERRLSGNLVWQTASQATALTIARSRGGKAGLRPRPAWSAKEKSPLAQRCRQRRSELGWSSTKAPAETFDNAGESWSRRTSRALWWWPCGTARLRTMARH